MGTQRTENAGLLVFQNSFEFATTGFLALCVHVPFPAATALKYQMFSKPSSDQLAKTSFPDTNVQSALSYCFSNFELTLYKFSPSIKSLRCTHFFSTRHHSVSLKKTGSFHVTSSDQLRSLEETRFWNNQSVIRYRICIKHNETIGVRHQRLLAFGPSLASLTSDLTLVSPAFGRPDLASELPLVPGYSKIPINVRKIEQKIK